MNLRLEAVNAVTALNEVLPSSIPPEQRTSVIRLRFTNRGVADPVTNKLVKDSFSFSDPRQAKESHVNLLMLDELEKRNGVGLWLSAPDDVHETGKILFATRSRGDPVLYDITGQAFSAKDFGLFATSLSKWRRGGYYFLEDLPWETLESIIPMPLVWEGIRNDRLEAEFNDKVEKALPDIKSLGTAGVRVAWQKQYGVDIDLACPTSTTGVVRKQVSPDGTVRTFAKHCGVCQREINQWLAPGDRCRFCGKTYLGVCK